MRSSRAHPPRAKERGGAGDNLAVSCGARILSFTTMSPPAPSPDRRRHRVYVTRTTEYHVRDGVCVAVRDRGTDGFRHGHLAESQRATRLCLSPDGMQPGTGDPQPGDAIAFQAGERRLVTGAIEKIVRPGKTTVERYRA